MKMGFDGWTFVLAPERPSEADALFRFCDQYGRLAQLTDRITAAESLLATTKKVPVTPHAVNAASTVEDTDATTVAGFMGVDSFMIMTNVL